MSAYIEIESWLAVMLNLSERPLLYDLLFEEKLGNIAVNISNRSISKMVSDTS